MKPSDRVRLIRQLAEELQDSKWVDIDFMLQEFSLPTTDEWQGTTYAYLIQMLQQGNNANLLALHEHIFGFSGVGQPLDADFWEPGFFRLFLTHISGEKAYAVQLKEVLLDFGIDAFVAHEDIQPTKEWIDEIESALTSCYALVADLIDGFKESDWTDQEVGYCHGRRVLIISLRRGLDPYGFISKYQAVRIGTRDTTEIAEEICRILLEHEKTAARMAESLVTQFERAYSFAHAKRLAKLLRSVASWTPELLRKIESAVPANDQLANAFGVPELVQGILREHGATRTAPEPSDDLPF